MKRISSFILSIIIIVSFSCSLDNNSILPDKITNVKANDLMPGAMSQVVYNQSNICGRMAGGIMQYLTEGPSWIQSIKNYRFDQNSFDNAWNTGYYLGSLANLKEMKKIAKEEGNDNTQAIANILLAHEFGTLTNVFGDIPLSQALQGDQNLTPEYDTQEDIYSSIFSLLDDAIEILGNSTMDSSLADFDLIYQGNLDGWRKFAFGLKARYLLNLNKRDPSVYSEILEIVRTSSFTSNIDQATFTFNSNLPNPLFSFGTERPNTLFIGIHFKDVLESDPRYTSFIYENEGYFNFFGDSNLTWTQQNSSIPLFSYTELKFIETEVLHLMEMSIEETSQSLAAAIESSFRETCGMSTAAIEYMNNWSNLESLLQSDQRHHRIINEAYKAYYGYGHHQSWNNYRRTGYPILIPTSNSPWDGNPSNIIPRRFPYPASEFQFNIDNLNEAIARQNGALLDDNIWLFE